MGAPPPFETIERARWRLLLAGLTGLDALNALLRHVSHRLLERRPILGLIGSEFETCLQRGDARIGKGGDVGGVRTVMTIFQLRTVAVMTGEVLLGIDQCRAGDS